MEDELQRQRDKVAWLCTDNERLSIAQNGGTGDDGRENGTQPVRREQAFYLPRERKCPKFSGSMTAGSLSVEGWVEEAQSYVRSKYV